MEPNEATVINIQTITTSTPSPIHTPANSLFNTFPLTSFIRKFRWRSKYPITPTPVEMSSASRQPALGKYLSPAGLQQLKAYKYVSAPLSSWVDQKMTHYWEWAVKLLPMWVAPNLVTTYSFMHAILAHLLVQYYSPTMGEAAPNWVYAAIAVCMFLYQTFDAIDGKQARRTKNGSPLGQLFDHGCDAVTAWIMGIFIAATLMRGPHLSSFVLMCMVVVPFFAANWEESCTHVFRFGIVGVTEGQFIVMGTELATSIVGPHFWQNPVFPHFFKMDFLPELTIFHCIICVGVIGGVYQVVSSVWTVWHYYESHPNENRRQAIVSFVQYFLHILFGFAWVLAPSDAMLNHPRIIMVTIGLLGSYQASRLIICHTTGEHYPLWFAIMWPLPFVVLNEWSGRLFHGKDHDLWFDQTLVGWAYLGYILALYIHFVHVTINQITTFLGIKCFKIKTHQAEH